MIVAGMLTLRKSANSMAVSVCAGKGRNAIKSPSENPGTTVLRRIPQYAG
jgi:hypothetical protein